VYIILAAAELDRLRPHVLPGYWNPTAGAGVPVVAGVIAADTISLVDAHRGMVHEGSGALHTEGVATGGARLMVESLCATHAAANAVFTDTTKWKVSQHAGAGTEDADLEMKRARKLQERLSTTAISFLGAVGGRQALARQCSTEAGTDVAEASRSTRRDSAARVSGVCLLRTSGDGGKWEWQFQRIWERAHEEHGLDSVSMYYLHGVKATRPFPTKDPARIFVQHDVTSAADVWPDGARHPPEDAVPVERMWMVAELDALPGAPARNLYAATTCRISNLGALEQLREHCLKTGDRLYIESITRMVAMAPPDTLDWLVDDDGAVDIADPSVFGFLTWYMAAHRQWRVFARWRRGGGLW
jgi:hypothetical protein